MKAATAIVCVALASCQHRPTARENQDFAHYDRRVKAVVKLRAYTTSAGQPLTWPAPLEMVALDVIIPVNAETGWHTVGDAPAHLVVWFSSVPGAPLAIVSPRE